MITLYFILLSFFPAVQKTPSVRPSIVQRLSSETVRDPVLEKAMEAYSRDNWLRTDRYLYTLTDLNGDGIPEVLVQLRGQPAWTFAASPTYVLRKEGSDYKVVSDLGMAPSLIYVSDQRTNGWSDLIFVIYDAQGDERDVALAFDGAKYPGNPIQAPAAVFRAAPQVTVCVMDGMDPRFPGVRKDGQVIRGVVVSETGKPLEGVQTRSLVDPPTDSAGRFSFDVDAAVLHFALDGYRPVTRLFRRQAAEIRVVLVKSGPEEWVPPACDSVARRFSLGPMAFNLSPKEKVKQTNGDDFGIRYVELGKATLRLGSGPGWSPGFPSQVKFYEGMSKVEERAVRYDPHVTATEFRGRRMDGTYFRWVGTWGTTIDYDHVSKDVADYFDGIMDSLCWKRRGQ